MRTKAIFVINPKLFPSGLVVTASISPTGKECCTNDMGEVRKNCLLATGMEDTLLTVSIMSNASKENYLWGILFILGCFFLICGIAVTVSAFGFVYKGKYLENVESEARELDELTTNPDPTKLEPIRKYFFTKDDLESLGIEINEHHVKRLRPNITLADLSKKMGDPSKEVDIYEKSDLHWRGILIVSIFYFISSFQVVALGGNHFLESGDQDHCYYNFLCLKPIGNLTAFNNVFSNIGYVCSGILFICLVNLKRRKFLKAIQKLDQFDLHKFGVPQDYSLFYGMGLALVMEGLMSACYHICPTQVYFQFDTTYMYLISILMMAKLYQNRHPDVSLGAVRTGILLGVVLVLEAISFYEHHYVFWIIFCLIHLTIIIIVAVQTYTLGALKYNHLILWNSLRLLNLEIRRALASEALSRKYCKITSLKVRFVGILIIVL